MNEDATEMSNIEKLLRIHPRTAIEFNVPDERDNAQEVVSPPPPVSETAEHDDVLGPEALELEKLSQQQGL
jgi:hypothetical protein